MVFQTVERTTLLLLPFQSFSRMKVIPREGLTSSLELEGKQIMEKSGSRRLAGTDYKGRTNKEGVRAGGSKLEFGKVIWNVSLEPDGSWP